VKTLVCLLLILVVIGCDDEPNQNSISVDLETHSAWVLDDRWSDAVVKAFEKRGVPYEFRDVAGERSIVWSKEHDDEVAEIEVSIFGRKPPKGRYISFLDRSNYSRLQRDLERLGIESHMYQHTGPYGELEYLYWDSKDTPQVAKLIESYGFRMYSEEELETLTKLPNAPVVSQ